MSDSSARSWRRMINKRARRSLARFPTSQSPCGGIVLVESGSEASRLWQTAGTVLRVTDGQATVKINGASGGSYVEHYSCRDGFQEGRASGLRW